MNMGFVTRLWDEALRITFNFPSSPSFDLTLVLRIPNVADLIRTFESVEVRHFYCLAVSSSTHISARVFRHLCFLSQPLSVLGGSKVWTAVNFLFAIIKPLAAHGSLVGDIFGWILQ